MAATTVTGSRSWRQSLAGRDRDFKLFRIPSEVVAACAIQWNSKRHVEIRLSTGRRLGGFCSVTSGTEIYIPVEFHEELRKAAWFDCEIVGEDTSDAASLRWRVS